MTIPKIEPMRLLDCLKKRHPDNPKEHNLDDLVASFYRFGFVAFPTLDEKSDTLVAGHGRCEALEQMRSSGRVPPRGINVDKDSGDWLVPVIRGIEFANDDERDAYILADNQHVINGGWSFERLTGWLGRFVDGAGFDGLGFPKNELDSLLGNFTQDAPPPAEPDAPEGFVHHDINVQTTYCCPKCNYEWSGKPKS